jgi:ADP-heptose:LPS heptosyltransferase
VSGRRALVSAARGLGDILRITPLVRVCAALGYEVDVLLAPDYAGAAELLRGAPEIRRMFLLPSPWNGRGPTDTAGLQGEHYDVAAFTLWSSPYQHLVRANRLVAFDRWQWTTYGDTACVQHAAAALGWTESLPRPFAIPSTRTFGIDPGTIALHPGCKPDWPWKKWHDFDALAASLPGVAIIGTPEDLDNHGTYFDRAFSWPAHARNYVGALSLADTAAVLRECAALVSNDSGLMHLGVALGVPTFGIFGITSPARESMRAPEMVPVTKGLRCEPACRTGPWGRRDCDRHLECLRTLSADDVRGRLLAAGVLR